MSKNNLENDGEKQETHDLSPSEAFGELLEHVGEGGKYQWRIFFIASFSGVFFSFNSVSAAFLAATPEYRCYEPLRTNLSIMIDQEDHNISNYIPKDIWKPKCEYYEANFSNGSVIHYDPDHSNMDQNFIKKDCDSWIYDDSVFKSTVVTEWDLVCDTRWMMSSAQASYMAGVLVGSLTLSELSDMYGRRSVSLLASVGLLATSIATSFSTHFVMFIVLRFFTACFISGMFIANFVIVMEFCGPSSRTLMGILYQTFSGVALCILPGIAYFVRDWRKLQIAISVPSVLLLLYFKILPESPRWLFCKGREEEAMKILGEVAKVNKRTLPQKGELETLLAKIHRPNESKGGILSKITNFFKNQAMLLRTPNMRRRCLIMYYSWFVVSMVYYGITFSGANINASVYLMVFLGGIAELLSYFLSSITLKRFGRRLNIAFCYIICGVACMLILAVPKEMVWLNITLANIGKFFNTIAFAIAYIYSAELVPTSVRNLAVGTSSMWARVGSISAPFIVDLLGQVHYAIPSTIFGVLSIIAGFLDLLLPETGNCPLPETIAEVEAMDR